MGLKYVKNMDPAAGGAQVLRAKTKKVVNYFEKKVHPRSFCAPCKILATCLDRVVAKGGLSVPCPSQNPDASPPMLALYH